LKIEKIFRPL